MMVDLPAFTPSLCPRRWFLPPWGCTTLHVPSRPTSWHLLIKIVSPSNAISQHLERELLEQTGGASPEKRPPSGHTMLFSHRVVAVAFVVVIALFLLLKTPKLKGVSPLQYLRISGKTSPEILNGTLGVSFIPQLPLRIISEADQALPV